MSALGLRARQVGGDHQRTVGARSEALGVQVVGLAGHRVGRVVAGVGEAEAHAERGRRQREQDRRAHDHRGPGPPLDGMAPARGGRVAAALLVERPAEQRDPQAVDPVAEVGEQRRQQRDRGQHHHEHGDRSRDRDSVHVGQTGEGEAEHGDHHGGAGDDHAAPGGGHGLDDRVVAGLAVPHRRAEPGQDEQRVVDAHADPDQPGDRRGPVGHVDDVGQQDDQPARGDAEAHEGDHERQAGRHHGAEGDQQHDRGAEEAEALGAGRLLGRVDGVAAELDLERAAAVVLGGGDQLLSVLLLDLPAGDRQRERGRADGAVLGDPDRGVRGDVLDLLGLGEEGVEALTGRRAPGAVGVLPDHVDLLSGVPAETGLRQVARRLGLGSRGVVVGLVLAGEGGAHADDHDRGGHPREDHATAAAAGELG